MFASNCRREDDVGEVKIKRLSRPNATASGTSNTPIQSDQAGNGSTSNTENSSPRMRAPSSPPLAGSTPKSPNGVESNSKSPHKRTISESNSSPISVSHSSSTQNFSEKQTISTNTLNELYAAATDYIESFSPRPSNASDQQFSARDFSSSTHTSGGMYANRRLSVTDELCNLQSSSQSTTHTSAAHDKIQKPKTKSIRCL